MYEYYSNNDSTSREESTQGIQENVPAVIDAKTKKKMEKKAKRRKTWGKIGTAAALGLAFGIMAGGAFQCVNRVSEYLFPLEKEVQTESTTDASEKKAKEIPSNDIIETPQKDDGKITKMSSGMDVSEVAQNAMPSIVSITNKSVQQIRSMWGMGVQEYESTSVGSGIILGENDEELLIVTNNHVIEGANTLTVGFIDDEIYEAYVKGTDRNRDLAVVAVKLSTLSDETKDEIRVAVLGDSKDLVVGEQVVAIGNALGYGQSVTTGIVSALDREVTIEDITNTLIQTDAAINPGNSGGALLNMKGELIGINSAKFASAQVEGMGYAIPIETVKPIVDELMNRENRELKEEADAGYLGITGLNVDNSVSKTYGIPEGVYLQEVAEGSPAEEAGLIKGDVITKFDGTSVSSISELKDMLLYYSPGEEISVVFERSDNGEYSERTTNVVLGDRKGTALDPERRAKSGIDGDKKAPDDDGADKGNNGDYGSPDGSEEYENNFGDMEPWFDFRNFFGR